MYCASVLGNKTQKQCKWVCQNIHCIDLGWFTCLSPALHHSVIPKVKDYKGHLEILQAWADHHNKANIPNKVNHTIFFNFPCI